MSTPAPDPHCPHCHGTGVMTLHTPFLDRVEEETVTCRCVTRAARQDVAAVPQDTDPRLSPGGSVPPED